MVAWSIRGGAQAAGVAPVPVDKSIAQRAVMFASLAEGRSILHGIPRGEDVWSTIGVFRTLGIAISETSDGAVVVEGRGIAGLKKDAGVLDCGNSGTTMRLLGGLLAGVDGMHATLVGDHSLSARPMARIEKPLTQMAATIQSVQGTAPLSIEGGALLPIEYRSPVASAQVKSCVLFAGLTSGVTVRVHEPSLSRDHSERMLRGQGIQLTTDEEGWLQMTPPYRPFTPLEMEIPGDCSSAAFFAVLGALSAGAGLKIPGVGVNPTRTGALEILRRMGAKVTESNHRDVAGEPVADLWVEASPLRGLVVEGDVVPRAIDEIPILAVAASCAVGKTVFKEVGELRVKETDRIAAMATELRKMGVRVEETVDTMTVWGAESLRGADFESHGDHRIAMAMAVAALQADGESRVLGAEAAAISFPEFLEVLGGVVGEDCVGYAID